MGPVFAFEPGTPALPLPVPCDLPHRNGVGCVAWQMTRGTNSHLCFAQQQRALFRHLNFQEWSDAGFVHFDFDMCFAPQQRALF